MTVKSMDRIVIEHVPWEPSDDQTEFRCSVKVRDWQSGNVIDIMPLRRAKMYMDALGYDKWTGISGVWEKSEKK